MPDLVNSSGDEGGGRDMRGVPFRARGAPAAVPAHARLPEQARTSRVPDRRVPDRREQVNSRVIDTLFHRDSNRRRPAVWFRALREMYVPEEPERNYRLEEPS